MSARRCPACGLLSPAPAGRCDCGYDFEVGTAAASHLTAEDRARIPGHGRSGRRLAGPGRRFVGYLIDVFVTWALIAIALMVFLQESLDTFPDLSEVGLGLGMALQLAYYLICESLWHRTPGKIVTDTRVVTWAGGPPTVSAVCLRTLSRLVPLEGLGVFTGWALHDIWSRTEVVRDIHDDASTSA